MSGFYLVHRGSMDNPIFAGEEFSRWQAWCWLIENAAWKDTKHRIGGKLVEIKRGQIAVAIRDLADTWGWSKGRVERFLKAIREAEMIRSENGTEAARSKTIITLCNYERYQAPKEADETATGTEAGQERDKNGTLKKEGKEDNKTKNYLFEGRVIRLTERDYAAWKAECPNLDDAAFRRELIKCDAHLFEKPDPDGKWYFRAKRWLLNADERAAAEQAKAKALTRPRWQAPNAKHQVAEFERQLAESVWAQQQ